MAEIFWAVWTLFYTDWMKEIEVSHCSCWFGLSLLLLNQNSKIIIAAKYGNVTTRRICKSNFLIDFSSILSPPCEHCYAEHSIVQNCKWVTQHAQSVHKSSKNVHKLSTICLCLFCPPCTNYEYFHTLSTLRKQFDPNPTGNQDGQKDLDNEALWLSFLKQVF